MDHPIDGVAERVQDASPSAGSAQAIARAVRDLLKF